MNLQRSVKGKKVTLGSMINSSKALVTKSGTRGRQTTAKFPLIRLNDNRRTDVPKSCGPVGDGSRSVDFQETEFINL